MQYQALCCDYDGTLAHDGMMTDGTAQALTKLKQCGRKLLMVTGREVEDLLSACPRLDLFDRVVAENGALLYEPATRRVQLLADSPPAQFIQLLRSRGVAPLSVGHVIVATLEPHETIVLEAIRDLGLELQVIFNKGSVMVLPGGINKATGLAVALSELHISPANAVAVGDAENDHAFLNFCGCAVAVANALPALKQAADFVTRGARGEGVEELIEELLHDDLQSRAALISRRALHVK
jgi:hydroxymethylpyrimidine pyrophosphatase-like HAD family hydrolase